MVILPAGYPADGAAAFELLKARACLSIDDLKVLALAESAGEAFYASVARGVSNEAAKELLGRNAQEERGHAHRVLKAIRLLGGATDTLPSHDQNPFATPYAADLPVDEDFLAALVSGERDGDLQYQVWADAESNAEVAELLRQNGREETRHGERVERVLELLRSH